MAFLCKLNNRSLFPENIKNGYTNNISKYANKGCSPGDGRSTGESSKFIIYFTAVRLIGKF